MSMWESLTPRFLVTLRFNFGRCGGGEGGGC